MIRPVNLGLPKKNHNAFQHRKRKTKLVAARRRAINALAPDWVYSISDRSIDEIDFDIVLVGRRSQLRQSASL